jgi:hypothetical protein
VTMTWHIRTVFGASLDDQPRQELHFADPMVYDDLHPTRAVHGRPIGCDVVPWLGGPVDVAIFTNHRHDGTLYFTMAAIDTIVRQAELYMQEHPGKWEASRVFINAGDRGGRHPWDETVGIALRAVANTSAK